MNVKRICPHCGEKTISKIVFLEPGKPEYSCNSCGVLNEDRSWYRFVSEEKMNSVIESSEPLGRFVFDSDIEVIGIDNSAGNAMVEEFPDLGECLEWLADGGRYSA